MTLFRDDCGYLPLWMATDRIGEFGVSENEARYWLIEKRPDGTEALIPDTCARLADRRSILIGAEISKL